MDVIAIVRARRRELNRGSNDGFHATKATQRVGSCSRAILNADT